MSDARSSIHRLLHPRSIGIVGASPEPFSLGGNVLANIEAFGFEGPLHLVSRKLNDINGRQCVRSISEMPHGVDLVALVVPAGIVKQAVTDCSNRGVGGVVVFASGFGELGQEGAHEQQEIAEIARRADMALLGPNCLGFTNFVDRVPMTFERLSPEGGGAGGVAILAQSGAMTGNVREALRSRGVPVSYAISTGNEAVIAVEDLMEALLEEDRVAAFSIFAEQIRNAALFMRCARRAWRLGKPVVLMHPGRSVRSREAALSHTGAMAGDHTVMETFVRACGVSLVDGFDELFDTTVLRHRYPQAQLRGLGVMTNSGAVRGFSIDFCEEIGLALPRLGENASKRLSEALPAFATIDNPLDITAMGMSKPSLFGETSAAMLQDPGVDALMIAAMGGAPQQLMAKWESLRPVLAGAQKLVALVFVGDELPMPPEFLEDVRSVGVPFFRSPERAMRAFSKMARTEFVERLPEAPSPASDSTTARVLPEYAGKAILADSGFPVPRGRLATSLGEARRIAGELGYPVALKVQSAAILHKSDIGGVKLKLADGAALDTAWREIERVVGRAAPEAAIDGMLVEAMVPAFSLEMIVSARRDPAWGVVVTVGLGGVRTELMRDIRMFPAGLPQERVRTEIEALRGAALLQGYRGSPSLDVAALIDALDRLGRLAIEDIELAEVEVNPLAIYPDGQGVCALDVLMFRQT